MKATTLIPPSPIPLIHSHADGVQLPRPALGTRRYVASPVARYGRHEAAPVASHAHGHGVGHDFSRAQELRGYGGAGPAGPARGGGPMRGIDENLDSALSSGGLQRLTDAASEGVETDMRCPTRLIVVSRMMRCCADKASRGAYL